MSKTCVSLKDLKVLSENKRRRTFLQNGTTCCSIKQQQRRRERVTFLQGEGLREREIKRKLGLRTRIHLEVEHHSDAERNHLVNEILNLSSRLEHI